MLPQNLVNKFVWECHLLLGHVGANKVSETVRRIVFWPCMQKDVTKVVTSCLACQKVKHPPEYLRGELKLILPTRPLQLLSVDLYGPLPKSKGGVHYILVAMDILTKNTKLYAIFNAATPTLVVKMKSFIEEVGRPEAVLSDNCTQFTSNVLQQGMLKLRVVPTTTSVRYPQSNPVERCMHTLGTTLRTYCNNSQQKWRDFLPLVEVVMNHTVHVSTSLTPFEALTNYRSMLLDSRSIPQLPSMRDNGVSREEMQKEVQELVRARLYSAAEEHKSKFKPSKLSRFELGSLVLLKTNPISQLWANVTRKLFNLYEGPYEVCEVHKENCYGLRDCVTKGYVGRYNVASLRRYCKHVVEAVI
ncbi:hypothetical protein PR048_005611 [Dryococelus australis]|uniref:RNA-directed DNA polymerase n=1 Tax=Dryococelus australis TaxID=614101 RepID=A0ABQ9I8Q9_9NEOP|nr:hypothetical protein PR048_005611 [Dryococelus australis]